MRVPNNQILFNYSYDAFMVYGYTKKKKNKQTPCEMTTTRLNTYGYEY